MVKISRINKIINDNYIYLTLFVFHSVYIATIFQNRYNIIELSICERMFRFLMKKQTIKRPDKQNKTLLIAAIALFLAVVVFFSAYTLFSPQATEGAKSIMIEIEDNTQTTYTYMVHTDAEYLIDAMKDIPKLTFSGYESAYGLTLISINGVSADWEKDNAFWCIYVNGEQGNYGVDTQPVNDGDYFKFEYTSLDANA